MPAKQAAISPSPTLRWLLLVVGLAAALGLLQAGQVIAEALPVSSLETAITLFYCVLFLPLIVLSIVIGAIEKRRVLRAGDDRLKWTTIGLASGCGGLAIAVGYVALNGALVPAAEVTAVVTRYIALALALTLLQVSAEEIMFRGWLLPSLSDRTGVIGGIALSALAFAAFHLSGGARAPLSLINLLLGGVWFALLALRSGGLLAPIAAHFGWNAVEDTGLGLVPNPGVGELGALWDYDITGPALWGGADEGLNASIAMTVVLIALILPLAWRPLVRTQQTALG